MEFPEKLTDRYDNVFVRNSKAKDVFNKMFSARLLAVYTKDRISFDKPKNYLDWGNETWYFINEKGKWGCMSNSEWASFSLGKLKDLGLSEYVV